VVHFILDYSFKAVEVTSFLGFSSIDFVGVLGINHGFGSGVDLDDLLEDVLLDGGPIDQDVEDDLGLDVPFSTSYL